MTMTHGMSGLGQTAYDFLTSESHEQGGTESGTVVDDSRFLQMLQALTSLTDDERGLLAELLKKTG